MFSLVYPSEPAPLTGRKAGPKDEILPIVEPTGLVVGRAARSLCHGGSGLLHPVVNLHVIDRYGRILLQKRSRRKHTYPLCWDTTVGGHVGYGEQPEEALIREAAEELHLTDFNPVFLGTNIWENEREKELVVLFAAFCSQNPVPDATEVAEVRWWTFEEIEKAPAEDFTPSFLDEFSRIKNTLQSLL